MIAYLSRNPFRISSTGQMLLCNDTFLRDSSEPITPEEITAINMFIGAKALKKPRFWRKELLRSEAVEQLKGWIATNTQH